MNKNKREVRENRKLIQNNSSDVSVQPYIQIDPDMNLQDFILEYPHLVEVLAEDYGFHCVNCMFSGWDTLREGAAIHQIFDKDFDEMITRLETILNSNDLGSAD